MRETSVILLSYAATILATLAWFWLTYSIFSYILYLVVIVSCTRLLKSLNFRPFASHLKNIRCMAMVGFVCLNAMLVIVIGTLGFAGAIINPVWVILVAWSCYRLVKG